MKPAHYEYERPIRNSAATFALSVGLFTLCLAGVVVYSAAFALIEHLLK